MSAHLDDDTLRRWVDGALHERWLEPVAIHLDACPSCADRLAALDPWMPILRAVPEPQPPNELIDRVVHDLRAKDAPPERSTGAHGSFSATLPAVAACVVTAALAIALRDAARTAVELGAVLGSLPGATTTLLAVGALGWVLALPPRAPTARESTP
jgi:hypothetical protein